MTNALAAVLLVTAFVAWRLWRGVRRLPELTLAPWPRQRPRVTIVVAARNEGDTLAPALRSLLAQRGLDPASRVIVVNDRSEDDTAAVLDGIAADDDRLRVEAVESLPEGWLGKNHALWFGAGRADGDWLLFTDADVIMEPEAVARAVGMAEANDLHHVAAMPTIIAPSPLLRIIIIQFAVSFLAFFRPWRLPHDQRCFTGIGAFNLVSAATYRAAGGHRAIALTPLDDILLGRLLRRTGARSRLALGNELMRITWYRDTRSMIRAFRKNGFAAFDYRVSRLVAATGLYLILGLAPWGALLFPAPPVQLLAAMSIGVQLALQAWFVRRSGWPAATALLAPLGTVLIIWMWWRAAVLTLWHGGIEWRGTYYPLDQLRAHHDRVRWS